MGSKFYGFTIGCQAINRPINLDCIKYATDIGMGTMRYQERAALVNPAPGQYDWTRLDAVVAAAMQANLQIVYTLQLPAPFGLLSTPCDPTDNFKQPDPLYMAGFAKVVAERYNGKTTKSIVTGDYLKIGAIEIGNEPDVHYVKPVNGVAQPQTCRVPELWIPIWQACIPAIRSVSDAEIGMGALWWENRTHLISYLEAMYQTPGLMQAFAYLNFHWYGGGDDPMLDLNSIEPSFPSEVALFQQVMAKYGDSARGLKCTEFGWQTSTIGTQGVGLTVDQATQQKYLQSALDVAQKAGMSGMYYFTLNEENGHSLVLKDPASGQLVYTSAYHYLKERIAAEQVVTTPAPAPIPPPVVLPPVPAPTPVPPIPPVQSIPPVPPPQPAPVKETPPMLNAKGEVADFIDESQFEPGETAFACVAFSAALCRYAGQPGKGPTGTGEQVDTTADFWYGKLEGSSAAANTNGMSLQAEYDMLTGLGMHYHALSITSDNAHNLEYVKAWLALKYPVLLCGAETGMFDMELGRVPYSWTPTGNHAIVASGIAPDGNLLVRDTASIAPTGVRPGPRPYDASKLRLVSATAISMPWLAVLPSNYDPTKGDSLMIDLTNPTVAAYFKQGHGDAWDCPKTGKSVALGMLAFYRSYGNSALCGLTYLGLPVSNEIAMSGLPGCTKQFFERGVLVYDPAHHIDAPPGAGSVYLAHLYNGGPGQDPLIVELEAQITTLQQSGNPALLAQYTKAKERIDQASAVLTAP